MDLHAGQQRFCDLAHLLSHHLQANFHSLSRPDGWRDLAIDGPKPTNQGRLFFDLASRQHDHPNALQAGSYVVEIRLFGENAKSRTAFIGLEFSGRFATLADEYEEGPLAGVDLCSMAAPPVEGYVAEVRSD